MNGEHDPDENPCLDEIISGASISVLCWLSEAEEKLNGEFGDGFAAKHPAAVAGYMNACATIYHAERINDAAHKISRALLAIADSIGELSQPMQTERLAGIENELYRLANKAGDALEMVARRGDGGE